MAPPMDAAATSLLYAPSDLAAVPALPAGCSDRSPPGTPIPAGAPVCTLRTEAAEADGAASRVAALKADLHAALFPCDM
ncbi:hypothetical protein [Segnochrobactrum spirostomi]|uniref:hypothetical protein n=1 Tax=Segnochrobactrum spirostomi TaxID=2608987 RepID=UPI001FE66D1D|nr:hypothetical protein [Segnochrobactrum spirostomi]